MRKILITGFKGTIGTIICNQLQGYDIVHFDLPEHNARDYQDVLASAKGCDMIIHLGWDTKVENWKTGNINPENALMTFNVYKVALEVGVPRVIMASSVHADDYSGWKEGEPLIKPDTVPTPDSPYGASKVFMEALGRYYARQGLQVVCIRFMGLNADNKKSQTDPDASKKWFSHNDCGTLIKAIIEAPLVPNNFVVMYGVSNNPGRMHDTSNPFGWEPKEGI